MVKTVTAFKTEHGTFHATELEAAQAEADYELKKLNMFNDATRFAIIKHRAIIAQVLSQLIEAEASLNREAADHANS